MDLRPACPLLEVQNCRLTEFLTRLHHDLFEGRRRRRCGDIAEVGGLDTPSAEARDHSDHAQRDRRLSRQTTVLQGLLHAPAPAPSLETLGPWSKSLCRLGIPVDFVLSDQGGRPAVCDCGGLVGVKSGSIHAAPHLGILHKGFPDKPGTQILRHQHGDSSIDPDHVVVVPVCERVERVYESIIAPSAGPVACPDSSKNAHYTLGQER